MAKIFVLYMSLYPFLMLICKSCFYTWDDSKTLNHKHLGVKMCSLECMEHPHCHHQVYTVGNLTCTLLQLPNCTKEVLHTRCINTRRQKKRCLDGSWRKLQVMENFLPGKTIFVGSSRCSSSRDGYLSARNCKRRQPCGLTSKQVVEEGRGLFWEVKISFRRLKTFSGEINYVGIEFYLESKSLRKHHFPGFNFTFFVKSNRIRLSEKGSVRRCQSFQSVRSRLNIEFVMFADMQNGLFLIAENSGLHPVAIHDVDLSKGPYKLGASLSGSCSQKIKFIKQQSNTTLSKDLMSKLSTCRYR